MVGPLQFAAIGAFATRLGAKGVMRPPHVALGRRRFSFRNRHAITPMIRPARASSRKLQDGCREKQGAELNRTFEPMQAPCHPETQAIFTSAARVFRAAAA